MVRNEPWNLVSSIASSAENAWHGGTAFQSSPSMSFPFIPRTVAKRNGPQNATVKVKTTLGSLPTTSQPNASSKGKEKAPEGPSAEECAILFRLALSEYALWMDSDLRMKLDEEDGCE